MNKSVSNSFYYSNANSSLQIKIYIQITFHSFDEFHDNCFLRFAIQTSHTQKMKRRISFHFVHVVCQITLAAQFSIQSFAKSSFVSNTVVTSSTRFHSHSVVPGIELWKLTVSPCNSRNASRFAVRELFRRTRHFYGCLWWRHATDCGSQRGCVYATKCVHERIDENFAF